MRFEDRIEKLVIENEKLLEERNNFGINRFDTR